MTQHSAKRGGWRLGVGGALGWRWAALRNELRGDGFFRNREGYLTEFRDWRHGCRWMRLCFRHDPAVGWRFLPSHRARVYHDGGFYTIRTNSAGFRMDREYDRIRPAGQRRIILLGDSATAGDGVSNGRRFSDLLEQRFPALEVPNFGLPGTGTDQQLLLYEQVASDWESDACLIGVLVEDIFRLRQTCRPALEWGTGSIRYRAKPYFSLASGELVLHHVPVPAEVRCSETLGDWTPDARHMPAPTQENYDRAFAADSPDWVLMVHVLERLCRAAAPRPVFVAVLPTVEFIRGAVDPSTWRTRFERLHDPEAGRYVMDLLPDFLSRPASERWACTFPHDPHYTELGHRVVADGIARRLTEWAPDLVEGVPGT